MKPAAVRLLLCAGVFAGWIGYLGYLVATRPPTVVSAPQILTSEIDIVARIDDPAKPVTVERVLWPEDAAVKPGDTIEVDGLADCRPRARREHEVPPDDFSGPGSYLVPLLAHKTGKGVTYEVAPVPNSPGFNVARLVRIYPATGETEAQYRRIAKPR